MSEIVFTIDGQSGSIYSYVYALIGFLRFFAENLRKINEK